MKELTKDQISHILEYIRERHWCNTKETRKHFQWLKKSLGNDFTEVLLKHGDPDKNGHEGYMEVMNKWWAELDNLTGV